MNHEDYCDELEREVDHFADTLLSADLRAEVPSCPGWTVRDLTEHLGTVHRWAEQLVRRRATSRVPLSSMKIGEVHAGADWLRAGGHALAATLRAVEPDEPMWAWGADQHVRFWSRRQLHETLVHRMDLELAMGVSTTVAPPLALDAVDEFLANMKCDRDIKVRARPGHEQERLTFAATGGSAAWNVQLDHDSYEFVDAFNEADVRVVAEPLELVALLLRRRPVGDCDVDVQGDRPLLDYWLAETAFR